MNAGSPIKWDSEALNMLLEMRDYGRTLDYMLIKMNSHFKAKKQGETTRNSLKGMLRGAMKNSGKKFRCAGGIHGNKVFDYNQMYIEEPAYCTKCGVQNSEMLQATVTKKGYYRQGAVRL